MYMGYLRYENNKIVEFDALAFLKDYDHNKRVLKSLKERLSELDAISGFSYDTERVQTSDISDPTATIAILSAHISSQIAYYTFLITLYSSAMAGLSPDDRWILETFFTKKVYRPAEQAKEHFHMEKTAIYRMRSQAIERFSDMIVGSI